jgi:coniferyl-aldehyde dehydrogenase
MPSPLQLKSPFQLNLHALIAAQRAAFVADGFPGASIRVDRLQRAAAMLVEHKEAIMSAVSADFGHRSQDETHLEIFGAVNAMRVAAANVAGWMRPEPYPALSADADARVERIPLGVVGVIGPWNFPVILNFGPLAGILAAGNRAILKPSELTPATSDLLGRLIAMAFHPTEVAMVSGGPPEGLVFARAPFDHLIFTGSTAVARHVMRAAAENLTPVTLELGGRCPVIVTDQFDLMEAAARIMTVKTRTAGQICLAPDHVFVPSGREEKFVNACVAATRAMYPAGVISPDYGSIISERHYRRLYDLVADACNKGARVINVLTADMPDDFRRFPPKLLLDVSDDMAIMQQEIFGPVLPIVGYRDLDDVLDKIRSGPRPLALSYFGRDDAEARRVLDGTATGGVTINDVMTHIFVEEMPFGGIGASGMGAYHGEAGFRTFSHARGIYRQSDAGEASRLFRPPYGAALRNFYASVGV